MPPVDLKPWNDVDGRYKVRFYSPTHGKVEGLLPNKWNESVRSQWEAPFTNFTGRFNTGLQALQEFANRDEEERRGFMFKELSTQLWRSGEPLTLDLSVLFVARKSAELDVVRPARTLEKMALPGIGGTVSAGEIGGYLGAEKGFLGKVAGIKLTRLDPPRRVMVEIGYMLRLRRAIIPEVNIEWSNLLDEKGHPNRATVRLRIMTHRIFVVSDFEEANQVTEWVASPEREFSEGVKS